jgi:UDP-N-acetylglucosamine--N-acetylmuramyl-(pentapeptide) pyrophosphoryl-undecaprenol N-acetylglucosamine transferase
VTVPEALARITLQARPLVRHQTGARGLEAARAAYAAAGVEAELLPFIDDMAAPMPGRTSRFAAPAP